MSWAGNYLTLPRASVHPLKLFDTPTPSVTEGVKSFYTNLGSVCVILSYSRLLQKATLNYCSSVHYETFDSNTRPPPFP